MRWVRCMFGRLQQRSQRARVHTNRKLQPRNLGLAAYFLWVDSIRGSDGGAFLICFYFIFFQDFSGFEIGQRRTRIRVKTICLVCSLPRISHPKCEFAVWSEWITRGRQCFLFHRLRRKHFQSPLLLHKVSWARLASCLRCSKLENGCCRNLISFDCPW